MGIFPCGRTDVLPETIHTDMEADQQFLEYVIKGLVDAPEKVKTTRSVDEMGVLLTLEVAPEDMGKIIGRSGNTAKAVRTLLRVVGMKNNSRVNLKINEPEGGKRYAELHSTDNSDDNRSESSTSAASALDEAMANLKEDM